MFTVQTRIGPSDIAGIGIFAAENIKEGTPVWKYNPDIDIFLTERQIQMLAVPCREQIYKYTYFDTGRNKYILCGDDARFFNHSATPNCNDGVGDSAIALRDIEEGEELTVDYSVFVGDMEKHPDVQL